MINISFFAGVEYNNKIYFSAYTHNGLYEMDLKTKTCQLISIFEKEDIAPMLHRQAFLYKNCAWFIPQEGKYIAKLNLDSLEISYFEFSVETKCEGYVRQYHAFVCGKKEGNLLYLIPHSVDAVVVVDMETDNVKEFPSVINPNTQKTVDATINGDSLYIFFAEAGDYRELNLKSGIRKDHIFNEGVRNVYSMGDFFWILTEESNNILKYDIKNHIIKKKMSLSGENRYYDFIKYKDEILFLPFKASGYLHLNIKKESIFEEKVEKIKLPTWKCKSTPIDSQSRILWSLGDIAYIAEMDTDFSIDYVKVEKEETDFFNQHACYIRTKEEWMSLYKCLSAVDLENLIGLNGFIKLVASIKDDSTAKCTSFGNEVWKQLED